MASYASIGVNEKLKEAAHYIIYKCGHKGTFGKTVLFKLLYFSDFNYYKLHFQSITGESYRKLQHGPSPCTFDKAQNELSKEGKIKVIIDQVNGVYKFKSMEPPQINVLNEDEIAFLDKVIAKVGHCNAKEISALSHEDTPWQVTKEKDIIEYDLVFYRNQRIAEKVE